jgi:outer membrane protein assembly factor BamB
MATRNGVSRSSVLIASALAAAALQAQPEWHQWRGANRDGHSQEKGLLQSWPEGGPKQVFAVGGVGRGYSSFSAAADRLFTLGATDEEERVIALDARTGLVLWRFANGPVFRNDRGDGPRGTPTVDGDRVFALGGNGRLAALDAATGKAVWQVDLLDEFRARNITWGISESPLVVDGKVLVNPGGRGASVAALDRDTGRVVWKTGDDRAGYSSAILADAGDTRQAIFFTDARALGVDLRDGRQLWSYERVANDTANVATPIFHDGKVFLSSDYGTGCALLELGPSGAREVYFNRDMRNHHSSSVLVGDTLYGFSSAILTAMDFDSGKVLWQDRSVGKGSLVFADGRLYLLSERGVVGLAEASPEGYREHGRFSLPERSGLPTWAHPMIHRGRLYLRDQDQVYAYDVAAGGR